MDIITQVASCITALGVIVAFCWKVHNVLNKPKDAKDEYEDYKEDIDIRISALETNVEQIQKDQKIQTTTMLVILDGLKQLGAGGEVTKGYDKLREHIVEKAYTSD